MFFPEGQIRVHLYGHPCDMRKSFPGLHALPRQGLQADPLSGDLFVFISRRATQMKVLYFDRSGFCIWSKRLEAGRLDRAREFERQGLTPTRPFTQALEYARERRLGLEVFLTDPDVPIDTNHLERALRAIPMGRKSWNFCWTELGAKHVGAAQSLIVTCRLHGIDPHTYLVDVLQRVGQQPAARVAELTPRLWKENFADHPLRSDLYALIA